jgi:cell division septation protein DedD
MKLVFSIPLKLSIGAVILVAGISREAVVLGGASSKSPQPAESNAALHAVIDPARQILEIEVLPPEGTKLNYLGPWKLQLEPAGFVAKSGKTVFDKSDFDQTAHKFSIPANVLASHGSGAAKTGGGKYTLTYFLCDKDEKWCVRKVADGIIDFKSGK